MSLLWEERERVKRNDDPRNAPPSERSSRRYLQAQNNKFLGFVIGGMFPTIGPGKEWIKTQKDVYK